MKKYNGRPFLLLFLAAGILLVLGHFAPEKIGNFEVKPIRLLSDVCVPETDKQLEKELASIPKVKRTSLQQNGEGKIDGAGPAKPCPPGMVPIDDYSEGGAHGMHHFYTALQNINDADRPVRIAYFGDSFIEGDIFTADLRGFLQDKFGGYGIGFTDMAPPFAGFRVSLPLQSGGWDVRNVLMRDSCERHRLGPTQRYALPLDGAYTVLNATKKYPHLDYFETASLYLKSDHPIRVSARINNDTTLHFTTLGNNTIETLRVDQRMHRIRWNVEGGNTTTCYGTALEGRKGIVLDNFSFRGSTGLTLGRVNWNEWSTVRPYDLIILHFGLNVASKDMLRYDTYRKQLTHSIEKLKAAYPEASFLIVSVSDREDKIDGELRTLPGVKALIKYQQLIAADNQIAFWNLYEAMGGEGSIVAMSHTHPNGARLDYTHITREGGKVLADLFFQSILFSFENDF